MTSPLEDLRDSFQAFSDLIRANPADMLRIPRVRSALSEHRFSRVESSLKPLGDEIKSIGRKNTAEYNLKGLRVGAGLDRGSLLFYPLVCQSEIADFAQVTRVLCLGPRNEAELLCALGLGIREENLKGLDLLSYSDLVDQGDMHKMPFPDCSFDIVIAGWVFAYSDRIERAVSEVYRILRPGGIVAVGWDHFSPTKIESQQRSMLIDAKELDPSEGNAVLNANDIVRHFSKCGKVLEVFYKQSSRYPYGVSERRNIVCMRVAQSNIDLDAASLAFREAIAYRVAKNMFSQSEDQDPKNVFCKKLLDQMEQDAYAYPKNNQSASYLGMRSLYFNDRHRYIRLDSVVKDIFNKVLPPHYSNPYESLDSRSILPDAQLENNTQSIDEWAGELRTNSYTIIQSTLRDQWITSVREHLEKCQFIDERNSKARIKDITKPGRYFADQSSVQASPDIIELAFSSELIRLAESYLGCSPIVDFIAVTYSIGEVCDKRSLDSSAQLFHRDKDRLSFLKIFVYITDVNEASGPHQLVESTHNMEDDRFNCDGRYETADIESYYGSRVRTILGKAGTIFAVDTHAIHRGKPLAPDNHRLMLQLQYSSSIVGAESPGLRKDLIERCLPNYGHRYTANPRLFFNCR